jgi:hypothetical protein
MAHYNPPRLINNIFNENNFTQSSSENQNSTLDSIQDNLNQVIDQMGQISVESLKTRFQVGMDDGFQSLDMNQNYGVYGTITYADGNAQLSTVLSTGQPTWVDDVCSVATRTIIRYSPGQTVLSRFCCKFPPVNTTLDGIAICGMSSTETTYSFVMIGGTFGLLLDANSVNRAPIHQLTLSGATTTTSHTISLNGVSFGPIITTGTTLAIIANQIALSPLWAAAQWSAQANGVVITFAFARANQDNVAYTYTPNNGATVGVFTDIVLGSFNLLASLSAIVPQSTWNVDTCDGSGFISNPSGFRLEPNEFNLYQIEVTSFNRASIICSIFDRSSGKFIICHKGVGPNAGAITPYFYGAGGVGTINPYPSSMTKEIWIRYFYGAVVGDLIPMRNPKFVQGANDTLSTSEVVILGIRNRSWFDSGVNSREVILSKLSSLLDNNASRSAVIRLYINPIITPTTNYTWSLYSETSSVISQLVLTGVVTISSGIPIQIFDVTVNSPLNFVFDTASTQLRIAKGESLIITMQTISSTAIARCSISFIEDG